MHGSDEHLDNAHLMRIAGRFSRRVRGFANAQGLPVIDCRRGERKHDLAEEYLARHTVKRGLFLILVGRAEAPLWDVRRAGSGSIFLKQNKAYVNHYSFHIMDPEWGHIMIKTGGHPPLRRADHPERTRVRSVPGQETQTRVQQGGQLFHVYDRQHTRGEARRYVGR